MKEVCKVGVSVFCLPLILNLEVEVLIVTPGYRIKIGNLSLANIIIV